MPPYIVTIYPYSWTDEKLFAFSKVEDAHHFDVEVRKYPDANDDDYMVVEEHSYIPDLTFAETTANALSREYGNAPIELEEPI